MASDAQLAMDIYGTANVIFYDDYDVDPKIEAAFVAMMEENEERREKHKVCPLLVRQDLSGMYHRYNIKKIIDVLPISEDLSMDDLEVPLF